MQPSIAHIAQRLAAEKGISLADAQRAVIQFAAQTKAAALVSGRTTQARAPRSASPVAMRTPSLAQIARRLSAQRGISLGDAQCIVVTLAAKARAASARELAARYGSRA